ncbi:class I SAM-dependent methyltransferase [Actinomyces sp. B33]|uniref:class I SAM-dependent methyltransferase n=1 Tax=Actinomyces sp. B33 TaxID=2942131 RepID=UPI00233FA530|nr:class I SAM-dependent methyltransferase [Actinomyces sp. B33]MDC4232371.1 class I SAM-dependent methyltransferase [Actinomyces sp. B33]
MTDANRPICPSSPVSAAERWEERYSTTDRLWSGRSNTWLDRMAAAWEPGRVLDIGCGEGDDLLWFAHHGWTGVGVDFSPTAIRRLMEAADAQGVGGRVAGVVGDAFSAPIEGLFDAVTVFFVHGGPDGDSLPGLLALQARRLAPGGRLAVATHAVNPPWRGHHGTTYRAEELLAALDFVDASWEVEMAEDHWVDIPATAEHGAGRRADALLVLVSPTR